jgi:hypothetical protein
MTVEERAVQRQIRRDEAFALKMMEVNILSFICSESRLPASSSFIYIVSFVYLLMLRLTSFFICLLRLAYFFICLLSFTSFRLFVLIYYFHLLVWREVICSGTISFID